MAIAPVEIEKHVVTYDVADLAKIMKCSKRHVRNMAAEGRIPGLLRFGRLVRFHRNVVDRWIMKIAKESSRD